MCVYLGDLMRIASHLISFSRLDAVASHSRLLYEASFVLILNGKKFREQFYSLTSRFSHRSAPCFLTLSQSRISDFNTFIHIIIYDSVFEFTERGSRRVTHIAGRLGAPPQLAQLLLQLVVADLFVQLHFANKLLCLH
jgi:hypothetical protein